MMFKKLKLDSKVNEPERPLSARDIVLMCTNALENALVACGAPAKPSEHRKQRFCFGDGVNKREAVRTVWSLHACHCSPELYTGFRSLDCETSAAA